MPVPLDLPQIIGIAADDVTGATDTVVQFSRSGWTSRLLLNAATPRRLDSGSAVTVTSDARPMDRASAMNATSQAVEDLIRVGANHLYLKIDSTMRGSVTGQLAGALSAWQTRHPGCFAVLCPAYPAMGRTLENGCLRVHGQPVEDSPAGRDPVTPVASSDIATLVTGVPTITLTGDSAEDNADLLRKTAAGGVVAVNASSNAELQVLAEALAAAGPTAIPAGSAGLASAMAQSWAALAPVRDVPEPEPVAPAQPTVVMVSSVHDVARAQTRHLRANLEPADLYVLQPEPSLLHDVPALEEWAAERLTNPDSLPRVILVLTPDPGAPLSLSGAAVARRLAAVVRQTVDSTSSGSLVLVGGDGAHAVLDALGATALLITGAIREGIPRGIIEGGAGSGRAVVTKAGGFGDISALMDTVNELTHYTALPSEAHS